MNSPSSPPDELDLRPLIDPLRGQGKRILAFGAVGFVLALIYTAVVTPVWQGRATILMIVEDDGSGIASALSSSLSPSAPDPLMVVEGVLHSRPSIEKVIKATGENRETVERGLETKREGKAAQISVGWADTDQKKALAAVQAAIDGLKEVGDQVGFTAASQQARLLKTTLGEREKQLRKAEDDLADYQKKMSAPSDPNDPASAGSYLKQKTDLEIQLATTEASLKQARSYANSSAAAPELPTEIPTVARFREKLVELEYQYNLQAAELGEKAPAIRKLKSDIELTRTALRKEIDLYLQSVDRNVDPNLARLEAQKTVLTSQLQAVTRLAASAPGEAVELGRRSREVLTLSELVTELRKQYETARVAAEVSKVRWNVLEKPFIEDKPLNKRWARQPVLGFVFGVVLSTLGIMFFGWRRGRRNRAA